MVIHFVREIALYISTPSVNRRQVRDKMATVTKRRRNVLCIKGKVKHIQQTENGREKVDVCREFNHGNSTT
jgi:hypothetical protein